jgi:putative endonuclease
MRNNRETGAQGEMIAIQFLVKRGYKLVSQNYRKPWGEIDIIAEKNNILHFFEVKTVVEKQNKFSREMVYMPEELAHSSKLQKVARTALLYMQEKRDEREFQIDVIGVIMNPTTRTARCRIFEQALGE